METLVSRAYTGALSVAVSLALVFVGGVTSAHASEVDAEEIVLAEFRDNLVSKVDMSAFDDLTAEQREELAAFFLGETDPFAEAIESGGVSGDFEVVISETTTIEPRAAKLSIRGGSVRGAASNGAATRTVSAWQSFLFAGITISKTTVRETYYYSGSSATRIASYSCVVNANYQPFTTITAAKDGAWVSSGRATAECLVTAVRGVPTPWGTIAWSTLSNIQFVTATGSGSVTSSGWR